MAGKPKFRRGQVVRIKGEWAWYRLIWRIDKKEPGVWLSGGETFPYRRDQLRPLTKREMGLR